MDDLQHKSLREKYPYSEFSCSLFIRMRENKYPKSSKYGHFSRSE